MDFLSHLSNLTWHMPVMWIIGGILIFLAIKKDMEPTLLLPMGFGAILLNLPNSGAVEVIETLYNAGIANELFPLLLFIGIGAMIDFGPLLSNPSLLLVGAAAQFGIFFTLSMARLLGFEMIDAASIGITNPHAYCILRCYAYSPSIARTVACAGLPRHVLHRRSSAPIHLIGAVNLAHCIECVV